MNMYVIKKYVSNMSIDDLKNIALKNDIVLNNREALASYNYIKSNCNNYLDGKMEIDDIINDASLLLDNDNYNKLYNIYLKYKENN